MILNETDSVKIAQLSIEKLVPKSEITDIESSSSIEIPAFYFSSDKLIAKNLPQGEYTIEIYDLSGKTIYLRKGENYYSDNIEFDTEQVNKQNGIMIIRLITKNEIFTTKIRP